MPFLWRRIWIKKAEKSLTIWQKDEEHNRAGLQLYRALRVADRGLQEKTGRSCAIKKDSTYEESTTWLFLSPPVRPLVWIVTVKS